MGKPVVEGSLESPPFEKPSIEQVKSQNVDLVGVWWVFLLLFFYIFILKFYFGGGLKDLFVLGFFVVCFSFCKCRHWF